MNMLKPGELSDYWNALTYSVKVRGLKYLWGSAGLTKDVKFEKAFILHIANDLAGEPVKIGMQIASGTKTELGTIQGKLYIPRKVGNSFLGQGTVFRHCPLCRSLYLRLWLTRRPCVRLFLRATRARSVPVLFRSGVRSGLYLRACRAQSADDYAHTRTVPASPDPLAHGRSPAAVAERS